MTSVARTDLATLAALRLALRAHATDADAVTTAESSSCARVVSQIAVAVQLRARHLEQALDALAACSRDPQADCSAASLQVEQARTRLAVAQQAQQIASTAVSSHESSRRRFQDHAGDLTSRGVGDLERLAQAAGDYLGRAGSSAGGLGGGSGGRGSAGVAPSATTTDLPDGCAAIAGAPDGYALVPLSKIDTSDSQVVGRESFGKGYSPEDLAWGHAALHETVLPALRAGKTKDYFLERDALAGRQGTRSLADTYSGFFESGSAIKLEVAPDGRLTVGNGYHRIWVAQQTGLTHVVARLR